MENCTIYSHELGFDKILQIVKANLPTAQIDHKDGGLQQSLIATIKGGFFSKSKVLKISYRQRLNPSYKLDKVECALTQNLAGMVNFIQSLPAKNEEIKGRFLHKVMSANCEVAFVAEPAIEAGHETVLRAIVAGLDGFVFAQPNKFFKKSNGHHFLDKDFNLILDTNGNSEIRTLDVKVDTKYHDQPAEAYSTEQIQRKSISEAFLASKGVKLNKNLPCVEPSNMVEIRTEKAVVDRAYALLVITAKGEGVEQERLKKVIGEKSINSFSPNEQAILESQGLNSQEQANATWRYESLYTMLWALGLYDELKYPSEICDVQDIVGKILLPSREAFEAAVKLRSKSEILDELDKTYRMDWACVDARITGKEVSGGIHPGIVYERHYSLNWLTNYQDQEWDDVQTDT